MKRCPGDASSRLTRVVLSASPGGTTALEPDLARAVWDGNTPHRSRTLYCTAEECAGGHLGCNDINTRLHTTLSTRIENTSGQCLSVSAVPRRLLKGSCSEDAVPSSEGLLSAPSLRAGRAGRQVGARGAWSVQSPPASSPPGCSCIHHGRVHRPRTRLFPGSCCSHVSWARLPRPLAWLP